MSCFDYPIDSGYILQKKRALKRELLQKSGLIKKKIALMSGSTIGEIKNILELFLLNYGIEPEFYEGEYSLFYEEIVFDDGSLAAFAPDVIYIHTSSHNIKSFPSNADSDEACAQKLESEFARFESLWSAAAQFNCAVIQNNFEMPKYRTLGNRDAYDVHGKVNFTRTLNQKMAQYAAANNNFFIHDIDYLSATIGLDSWLSPATWYAYKYCLDVANIPALCHSLSSIIKSIFGKNKKALVLDLDNTLWGGIIGDDGAEGIVMGKESPAGMAYSELQAYVKELSYTGVMLNVCSKNELANAKAGFERSDSILKFDDFLCFKANWEPKHLNIAAIAQEINILPDSLVFLDDNPAEREIVMQELSGVGIVPLTDAEEYTKLLDRSGYFEATAISSDDKKRNEMYKQNLERQQLSQSFSDYNDYLKSLEMYCDIGGFDAPHAERITQLINKTNQFNLTTKRYNAAEIESIISDKSYITIYGRLVDKFGDNGIVTAIIGHIEGDELNIDLWIMSCRTFKRRLEHAMFDRLVQLCIEKGIKKINGFYYPTAKNLLVADFYATIGFDKITADESKSIFSFNVKNDFEPLCGVMKINLV